MRGQLAHPLGRSGHGGSAEMLQALDCHLAIMVLYVVLLLEVLSLSAFVVLSATL